MKRLILIAISLIIISSIVSGQDGSAELLEAVNALKRQQAEIADNQGKLDQKMAEVAESIRVARIFMSRAGGKHKPPTSK